MNGIVLREQYRKVTGPGRSPVLADYESTAILESEKGSAKWKSKGAGFSFDPSKALRKTGSVKKS